eukprot:gnl/TRDRNA2_/TRDRNA2_63662_c0_seq1.p1 gnl/TRDRNA2_/TRDRNA2_63662_c0~~gnl/TRDRNA2_/TRDRNA2_63662_c0_seq1.p1  ORF type:complete len:202 (+),score=29.18 gnl/TRDRNA2_/TRDRNA2_63662_c0_seq1:181-786(+)
MGALVCCVERKSAPNQSTPRPSGESKERKEKKEESKKDETSCMGVFLCYSRDDASGTLYQQWSDSVDLLMAPPEALAFAEPGVKIPTFKFVQNAGRIQMGTKTNTGKQHYIIYAQFVSEVISKHQATRLVIMKQNQFPSQVVLRDKDNRVQNLREGSLRIDSAQIGSVAVVHADENAFNVQTMDQTTFMQRGAQLGGASSC